MEKILLIIFFSILIIMIAMLVWLFRKNKKLKQDILILSDNVDRNNKDIAGLCSAAVSVDDQMIDSYQQIKGIVEKVTDFEQHEQQPYYNAIQQVRNGASVDELVQGCSLSQEEAALLIRLHRV